MMHPSRIAYVPALDGLRGLAVAAVLLYHADVSWARGGFLGVDAFFVLSGYLITSLLLGERRSTGHIDLGAFWARRARRLLPGLFLVLAFVALYAAVFAEPGQIAKIRGDALATLGYIANWRQIFAGESYFDQFSGPSPLRHTWSLAIEEQWYLFWPIIMLLVLRLRRGSGWALGAGIVTLAAGSALLMAALFEPGSDPSRPYYGTDTRAQSLLVGAGLALLLAGRAALADHRARATLQVLALGSAGFVAWLWVTSSDSSAFLYRGGLLCSAVAVAAVIASATQDERGIVGRALAFSPLRGLGLISYGVYLWHWPLYLTLTEQRTGLDGYELLAVRLGATLAVAAASYYIVEMPVRRGAPMLSGRLSWVAAPATAALLAVALVLTTRGGTPSLALPDERIDEARVVAVLEAIDFPTEPPTPRPAATPVAPGTSTAVAVVAQPRQEVAPPPAPVPATATPPDPVRVLLAGDSLASTLPQGMYPFEATYGFVLRDASIIACGIVRGEVAVRDGFATPDAECQQRPQRWQREIAGFRPDVAVMLPGLWDGRDHRVNGEVLEFGTPQSLPYWRSELSAAANLLASGGAHVVLLTTPLFPPGHGAAISDERVALLNRLLRELAAANPGRMTVIDLNGFLYPDGVFIPYINGINVRGDGFHFSPDGAVMVGRWLTPQLAELGK